MSRYGFWTCLFSLFSTFPFIFFNLLHNPSVISQFNSSIDIQIRKSDPAICVHHKAPMIIKLALGLIIGAGVSATFYMDRVEQMRNLHIMHMEVIQKETAKTDELLGELQKKLKLVGIRGRET